MASIAVSILAISAHIAAPTTPPPPPRVSIVLDVDAGLPPAILGPAVREAAGIWAPYRVDVTLRRNPAAAASAPAGALLGVRLIPAPRSTASSSPFGSIQFVDGRPAPLVFLHYEAIGRALAGSGALGLREGQWPPALRHHLLGRIVGRVLAHEIGHFVLRSPRHASRGLMRPLQPMAELIAGNGEVFGLTPGDLELLRAAITLQGVVDTVDAGG